MVPGPVGANNRETDDDDVVIVDSEGHEVVVAEDEDDIVLADDDDIVVVEDDYDVGEVIPVAYLDERYYIDYDDYDDYHIHAPPRGYRWMRSSASELLLVAVATGLVVKALSAR
ncbi:MAG TPA: RcnB family protein [Stenotrophomonas sp.]|nr:RcnB family protein [Stenotrophomonas sp.]